MKCNLALWDRILRFFFGVILTIWAIVGGPIWAWFGIYLLFTSGWGLCPIYASLNIKSLKDDDSITSRINSRLNR